MEQLKYTVVEADDKKGAFDECDLVGSISISSSSSSVSETSSGPSLESESFEEVTSHPSSYASSADDGADPLSDMSSLIQQLPIKRGLSKYYQGKAQSFTSLAKVYSLEDLAKPESPYKRLKSCRSYGGKMVETHNAKCTTPSAISQRGLHSSGSRGSDNNFMGSRPPIPPLRSTSTSTIPNQTALFV